MSSNTLLKIQCAEFECLEHGMLHICEHNDKNMTNHYRVQSFPSIFPPNTNKSNNNIKNNKWKSEGKTYVTCFSDN